MMRNKPLVPPRDSGDYIQGLLNPKERPLQDRATFDRVTEKRPRKYGDDGIAFRIFRWQSGSPKRIRQVCEEKCERTGSMFVLTKLKKELRIAPQKLSLPLLEGITGEIQALFFDKVLKDLGLCVTLYDVRSIEGGFVFPGDGAPCFTVEFQLVMFRPFVGEVLTGKLKKCDKSGLYISLQFFEDIHIPEHLLQQPSVFDENEKLWIWNFNGNDMFMDLDEEVRFRVVQVKYLPILTDQEKGSKPFAPMEIIGDINADGLGLVSWW